MADSMPNSAPAAPSPQNTAPQAPAGSIFDPASGGAFGASSGSVFAPGSADPFSSTTLDTLMGRAQHLITKSGDKMTLNLDPDHKKDPSIINVLERAMDVEKVKQLDGGKALLDYERKSREGRRGFGEAISEFGVKDVPFVGDFVGAAVSIREMRRIGDTFKRLENHEEVSDQDLVYARLYLASQERQQQESKWGTLGDMLHGFATMGAEMWLGAQAGALIAAPFAAGTEAATLGVGTPVALGEEVVGVAAGASVGLVRGVGKWFAKRAVDKAAKEYVTRQIEKNILKLTSEAAGKDFAKVAMQRLKSGAKQLVTEAPLKAAGYAGLKLAAGAAVNAQTDGDPFSSRAQYEKEIEGVLNHNDRLVKHAQAFSLADQFMNYYMMTAGEGLGKLLSIPMIPVRKAAGMAIENAPAVQRYAKLIEETWGKPEELRARQMALDAMTPAERAKHVSTLGMWAVNQMVEHNINLETVGRNFNQMGYHGWFVGISQQRYGSFLRGLYGSDGDDPGLQNAWKKMWPTKDQLFSEAISFAIPIAVMQATARMQQMKSLGGLGVTRQAAGMRAGQRVVGEGGAFLTLYGEPAEEAAPGVAGEKPADKLQLRKDDLNLYVDTLMEASERERPVANNGATVMQRVAKASLKALDFAVSGNFDAFRNRGSLDRMALDYGLHPDFVRRISQFEEAETKRVRDGLIAKRTAPRSEAEAQAIPDSDVGFEKIRASKEVQEAKRAYAQTLVSQYAAARGRIALAHSDIESLAKKYGVNSREVADQVKKEAADKTIDVWDHGNGFTKTIIRRTVDGKSALNAVAQAARDALGPARAIDIHKLSLDTLRGLESLPSVPLTPKLVAGDREELMRMALATAPHMVDDLDGLHEFILLTHALRRAPGRPTMLKLTEASGATGWVTLFPKDDGTYRTIPHPGHEAWFDSLYSGKPPELPKDELIKQYQARGLSPEEQTMKIDFLRAGTHIAADDVVRLLHEVGYDPVTAGKDGEAYMKGYIAQLALAKGSGSVADAAREYVKVAQDRAKNFLMQLWDTNEAGIHHTIGGEDLWSFTVGGMSTGPGHAYVSLPSNLKARNAASSLVEEILESAGYAAHGGADGKSHHREYHQVYFKELASLAARAISDLRETKPKVAEQLEQIVKLLSSASDVNYSADALSKTVGTMLFGHGDASVTDPHGQRMAMAAGWSELRQRVMKDGGTPEKPGLRELTAGFMSKYAAEVLGWGKKVSFADFPQEFFPKDAANGFQMPRVGGNDGPILRPLQDFHSLEGYRIAGEQALENKMKENREKAAGANVDPLTEQNKAHEAADVERQRLESERKAREQKDAEEAKFGKPTPADAGFASEDAAKEAHEKEKIGKESLDEFLLRKFCMSGESVPSPDKAQVAPAEEVKTPRQKRKRPLDKVGD